MESTEVGEVARLSNASVTLSDAPPRHSTVSRRLSGYQDNAGFRRRSRSGSPTNARSPNNTKRARSRSRNSGSAASRSDSPGSSRRGSAASRASTRERLQASTNSLSSTGSMSMSSEVFGNRRRDGSNSRAPSYGSPKIGTPKTFSSEGSSSDDEDLDELVHLPHLQQAIPLHLREAVIRTKTTVHQHNAIVDYQARKSMSIRSTGSSKTSRRSRTRSKEHWELKPEVTVVVEPPPAPQIPVRVRKFILWSQGCCLLAWSLLAIALLAIYVVRFFSPLGDDMHRFVADAALLKMEAETMVALSPAFGVVRSAALSALAGLFNTADPVASIALAVVPFMAASPALRHVQVVGDHGNLALLRPGTLHNSESAPEARRALIYSLPAAACQSVSPLACFGLNVTGLRLVDVPSDAAAVGWLGPEYLQVGPQGEPLGADQWVLAVHLMALVHLDAAGNRSIAIDVAVDVSGLAGAAKNATPDSGAVYVCTETGELLGGSDWQPVPTADPYTGRVIYPRVWDLPVEFLRGLSPAAVAARERSEHWNGRASDLLVTQPLLHAAGPGVTGAGAAGASLRTVVLSPRRTGVRPLLGHLAFAAMGVIAAPLVACLVIPLTYAAARCVACSCRCGWRGSTLDDDQMLDFSARTH